MRHLLFFCTMLISVDAIAIDCGMTMRAQVVRQMQSDIDVADRALVQHLDALLDDSQRQLAISRTDAQLNEVSKLQNEMEVISAVQLTGERVSAILETAETLILARDRMINAVDKKLIANLASLKLIGAGHLSQRLGDRVGKMLTRLTRPAVAIDAAKMRDAVGAVARNLENCTKPNP